MQQGDSKWVQPRPLIACEIQKEPLRKPHCICELNFISPGLVAPVISLRVHFKTGQVWTRSPLIRRKLPRSRGAHLRTPWTHHHSGTSQDNTLKILKILMMPKNAWHFSIRSIFIWFSVFLFNQRKIEIEEESLKSNLHIQRNIDFGDWIKSNARHYIVG